MTTQTLTAEDAAPQGLPDIASLTALARQFFTALPGEGGESPFPHAEPSYLAEPDIALAGALARRATGGHPGATGPAADAGVVTTVMLKYHADYNRWPGFATNNEAQHLTDGVWVKAMSPAPGEPMPPSNPKRIVFFEAGAGALDKTTGAFVDPWGNPFEFQVDVDGNGEMGHPAEGAQTFRLQAIAWSAGPDGDYASWEDNPTSWE